MASDALTSENWPRPASCTLAGLRSVGFDYVQTDVPPGMTIREWRCARHTRRRRRVWRSIVCTCARSWRS